MLFGKLVQYKCFLNSQSTSFHQFLLFGTASSSRRFHSFARFRNLVFHSHSNQHRRQYHSLLNSFLQFYLNALRALLNRLGRSNFTLKSLREKLANAKLNTSNYLAGTAAFFSWNDWKITNEDIKNEIDDMLNTFKKNTHENSGNNNSNDNVPKNKSDDQVTPIKINFEFSRTIERDNEWKKVYDKKDLIIWRRKILINADNTLVIPVQDNGNNNGDEATAIAKQNGEEMHEVFEYKVLGRLNDVTPFEFFHTQVDLDFRKEWDYLVIQIESLDKEETTNTEVIKWLMKFPYPLYPREYVFVRRYCLEPKQKVLVVVSKSLPDIKLPNTTTTNNNNNSNSNSNDQKKKEFIKHNQSHQSSHHHLHHHHNLHNQDHSNQQHQQQQQGNVRVTSYKSNMIILPHGEFDEKGLDYVIQYYDDSKARIPKLAYKWVTASGLPDYTEKLHKATLRARSKLNESFAANIFKCCDNVKKTVEQQQQQPPKNQSSSSSSV